MDDETGTCTLSATGGTESAPDKGGSVAGGGAGGAVGGAGGAVGVAGGATGGAGLTSDVEEGGVVEELAAEAVGPLGNHPNAADTIDAKEATRH